MLILSRKAGENIIVTLPGGEQMLITVTTLSKSQCKLGFEAPKSVNIVRGELAAAGRYLPSTIGR